MNASCTQSYAHTFKCTKQPHSAVQYKELLLTPTFILTDTQKVYLFSTHVHRKARTRKPRPHPRCELQEHAIPLQKLEELLELYRIRKAKLKLILILILILMVGKDKEYVVEFFASSMGKSNRQFRQKRKIAQFGTLHCDPYFDVKISWLQTSNQIVKSLSSRHKMSYFLKRFNL